MRTADIFKLESVSRRFSVRQGIFARGPEFAAIEDIHLELKRGVFYGLVGESGSGKSTFARLLTGLLAPTHGRILFEGSDLAGILRSGARDFRGKVQMIFQNPYKSLDPLWRVDDLVSEGIGGMPAGIRRLRVLEVLEQVGLGPEYARRLPAGLSGGERQRVALARSLAMRPEFLILDEPTSQLDLSTQSQILKLLTELRPVVRGGMLFISHDLALVSQLVDEVIVLHHGRVVEQGPKKEVLRCPKNVYTRRLIEAIPKWGYA